MISDLASLVVGDCPPSCIDLSDAIKRANLLERLLLPKNRCLLKPEQAAAIEKELDQLLDLIFELQFDAL